MRKKRRRKHSYEISSFFQSTSYIIRNQYLPAGGAEKLLLVVTNFSQFALEVKTCSEAPRASASTTRASSSAESTHAGKPTGRSYFSLDISKVLKRIKRIDWKIDTHLQSTHTSVRDTKKFFEFFSLHLA
jgi:hypothetical protein